MRDDVCGKGGVDIERLCGVGFLTALRRIVSDAEELVRIFLEKNIGDEAVSVSTEIVVRGDFGDDLLLLGSDDVGGNTRSPGRQRIAIDKKRCYPSGGACLRSVEKDGNRIDT